MLLGTATNIGMSLGLAYHFVAIIGRDSLVITHLGIFSSL